MAYLEFRKWGTSLGGMGHGSPSAGSKGGDPAGDLEDEVSQKFSIFCAL